MSTRPYPKSFYERKVGGVPLVRVLQIAARKQPVVGARIVLVSMQNDPDPIAPGSKGTVTSVNQFQIGVQWDDGRTLALAWPEDQFQVL